MKCPECKEVSTFTAEYSRDVEYTAPICIDDDENGACVDIDYDSEEIDRGDQSMATITCDKCYEEVCQDEIEIVEVEETAVA